MKKNILLVILLISAVSLTVLKANASDTFRVCHTCSSNSSYTANAIESASEGANASVYVLNVADNTIKKYQTFYEPELNQTFVSEITVDSATQSGFDDVVSAYNSLTQYLQGYQEVPEHIAPSAYSMMGASFVMNDVFDHYSQEATLLTHVTVFISSSLSLLGEIIDIPLHVEVSFADGSSAILNIVSILPNGDIELELASAKDVDNNTISTEASGYTDGLYRFTAGGESAIQEFMAAASRYGVGVCRQGSCFSGETEVDMNCAWVGDVYTCTVTGKKETVIPN